MRLPHSPPHLSPSRNAGAFSYYATSSIPELYIVLILNYSLSRQALQKSLLFIHLLLHIFRTGSAFLFACCDERSLLNFPQNQLIVEIRTLVKKSSDIMFNRVFYLMGYSICLI